MATFLLLFLTVYTGMHAVFYHRVHVLLGHRKGVLVAFAAFLGLMILAPIFCRLLERSGWETQARVLAHVGYSWMGFLFLAFWCSLAVGAVNTVLGGLDRTAGLGAPRIAEKPAAVTVIALAGVLSLYGAFEARTIRLERIRVETEKLPPHMPRLVVAQISDVHLGLNGGEARAERILRAAQAVNPDLLVSTGDLVDGAPHSLEPLLPLFQGVRPLLGKVAIVGNHEYYAGLHEAVEWTRRAGFTVLKDNAVTLADALNVVGVDDTWQDRPDVESGLLRWASNGLFTLYLKHRPQVCPETIGLFDLQLSGHTHHGQIFPFALFVALMYPLSNGTHDMGKGSMLHTSRGTGTWGPPIRVLAPPEITVFEIVRKN